MAPLSADASKLLGHLVKKIQTVDPRRLDTYTSYKKVCNALNIDVSDGIKWGNALENRGLRELAYWLDEQSPKPPAITGIITNESTNLPAKSYFDFHNRAEEDFEWLFGMITRAKAFDWQTFIAEHT